MESTNATIIPIASNATSEELNPPSYFKILIALPPNIAGTARKNVNYAAAVLEIPSIREPTMVEPERDVPGKIAAIIWNTPIKNA